MNTFANIPTIGEKLEKHVVLAMNPIVLAFIGDNVQQLYVRTRFVKSGDFKAHALHKMVSAEVKAPTQALLAKRLFDTLTEEEQGVFKRARNAKVGTTAKNASVAEYHLATAIEAVFGFLYLLGNTDRLGELLGG